MDQIDPDVRGRVEVPFLARRATINLRFQQKVCRVLNIGSVSLIGRFPRI